MLRTIGWVLWFFAYMLSRIPFSWKAHRLAKQGRTAEREALITGEVAKWATTLLRHIKMQVTLKGGENLPAPGAAVVYAANHQSYLDIPVLLANLTPTPPLLAKSGLDKVPLLRFWMRELGCIFVQRDDVRAGVAALKAAEELVSGGKSLIVFPEGTRSRSDAVNTFEPGAVRIAARAGAPIVPIAISGTYKGLEEGNFRIKRANVTVKILPPVPTKGLDRTAQKALPGQLQSMITQAKSLPAPPA